MLSVSFGMSKIPPEFRQAALKRAGVDRQEVSDRLIFHKECGGKGRAAQGQMRTCFIVLSEQKKAPQMNCLRKHGLSGTL